MNNELTNARLYADEIIELVNEVEEMDYKTDLLMDNFKEMFMQLSTNN